MSTEPTTTSSAASTAAQALAAAGDAESARDVGALDDAAQSAAQRLGANKRGLVERLIYGPSPDATELQSGADGAESAEGAAVDSVMATLKKKSQTRLKVAAIDLKTEIPDTDVSREALER